MDSGIEEKKKEVLREIIGKAIADKEYSERLKLNPMEAIKEIFPDIESNFEKIEVTDQRKVDTLYLNISLLEYALVGGDLEELELTEEELELVAGGGSCWIGVLSCATIIIGDREK